MILSGAHDDIHVITPCVIVSTHMYCNMIPCDSVVAKLTLFYYQRLKTGGGEGLGTKRFLHGIILILLFS